ncbi:MULTISPECIES: helix-turn-helix transcriptional regulator [unclassified Streptomyces]|uniref:helix-turn-helix domain-containing protein n=1 Tax=unclassified Streptomyces TaxID=2593676 RepID=UPI00081F2E05|nr:MULTISPECIES: helix-turn-helix transcriptional regulator [unclassified Streptomyces]MYZ38603.1 helix-turn-helix domain-containing protein [Streptomyces sp. SID4917]SCF99450.1 Helix-turn-helix domain-containing protein [Streptomyces sp. MnatMP-M17]
MSQNTKPLDPSSSPRAMLGAELRYHREKKGMSQGELGQPLFVSGAFIGMLEMGVRRMQPEFAVKFDEIFGTEEYFFRNCEVLKKSKYPDHFAEAAEAEATAVMIKEYAPALIPGLFQTPGYAKAVFYAGLPTATDDTVRERVEARLERSGLLQHPTKPVVWAVLDEAVLRRVVGGPSVMAEALRHIAALVRSRRIIVQVLPFTAGGHPAIEGALKLMAFEDAPKLAYLQGFESGQLVDDPATVIRYELAYDLVGASAMSPEASLALLESVAEDYAHEEQQP